jgi:L-fucose isomerase-like protein
MIDLQQDADGFIRMNRHFPSTTLVTVTFTESAPEVFTGARLNEIYDEALADFRSQNRLDAKGFSRAPAKTVQPMNNLTFVKIAPSAP